MLHEGMKPFSLGAYHREISCILKIKETSQAHVSYLKVFISRLALDNLWRMLLASGRDGEKKEKQGRIYFFIFEKKNAFSQDVFFRRRKNVLWYK